MSFIKRSLFNHWAFTIQIGLNFVVGYLFLKVLALKFGTSAEKDGFDIAYSVPFIIMSIGGFMFLHGIITTKFSKMRSNASANINTVFSTTLNCMLLFGTGLVGGCILFSSQITELLAPGLSPPMKEQTRQLIILMMPLVLTLGIGTYFSAILAAYSVPLGTEFCQLVSRLGVVGGTWILGYEYSLTQVALSLLFFSGCGLLVEWVVFAKATGLKYELDLQWKDPQFQDILRQGVGFLVAAALAQVAMSYMRRLATLDGVGTVAALTYVFSLISPLSLLIGKPLALIAGPLYIRLYERGDFSSAKRVLLYLGSGVIVISMGIVLTVNLKAGSVITLLYGGGEFDATSIAVTTDLLKPAIWALPPAMLVWIAFFPLLNDSKVNVAAATYIIGYIAQMVFSYLLFEGLGKYGLVWSYVLSIMFQALTSGAYMYVVLNKRIEQTRDAVEECGGRAKAAYPLG